MRVSDLQQIMLQTDTVSNMQQQGSHGAEVAQGKLAAQHLVKEKEKEKQVQTAEDTVFIKDRDARKQQKPGRSNQEPDGEEIETDSDCQTGEKSPLLSRTGLHIDITI